MSRPRVVLLHGFPLDCRMWQGQRAALESAGYGVLAPDLPGPDAQATIGSWAERILATTEEPLVPVGVSMGGYVAFELWRRASERIRALVLADTRATADPPEARERRDAHIRLLEGNGVAALWDELRPSLFAAGASDEVVARARMIALEQGPTRLAAALAAMRDREDSTPLLPDIDVPTLVVVGEEDALIGRRDAEALADAIPNARLVAIPGSGHLPPLERPDELNGALLSFLEEVAG